MILTSSYRVILVQDFWRLFPIPSSPSQTLIQSPPALKDISKQVDFYIELPFSPMEGRLAYDCGRVAVASAHAVYVFTLDSRNPPWPNLRLREVWFGRISSTLLAPCLELAETKLYLMFPGGPRNERGENTWCYDIRKRGTSLFDYRAYSILFLTAPRHLEPFKSHNYRPTL